MSAPEMSINLAIASASIAGCIAQVDIADFANSILTILYHCAIICTSTPSPGG